MHQKGSDGWDNFRKSAGGNVAEELEEGMRWRRRRRSRRRERGGKEGDSGLVEEL